MKKPILREKWSYGGKRVKISTDFVKSLIESDTPLFVVADELLSIWLQFSHEKIGDFYYKGEEEARAFEEFILRGFDGFFRVLAKACVNGQSVIRKETNRTSFVVMDGMSFREGVLIYGMLKEEGYEAKISYGFSAVPSDTFAFREKLDVSLSSFREVRGHKNIRVSGKEKYVWSYFPDVMLDRIQVGRAVISSLEEMYDISAKIVKVLVSELEADRIFILSDHGYIRSEAGFVFSVSGKAKRKLQEVFGSKRFVQMDDIDLSDLVKEGYVAEFAGYYLAKSRYVWPVKGRYSLYLHGGLSLMECLTPVIEVVKARK
jgi:hypothetical protein